MALTFELPNLLTEFREYLPDIPNIIAEIGSRISQALRNAIPFRHIFHTCLNRLNIGFKEQHAHWTNSFSGFHRTINMPTYEIPNQLKEVGEYLANIWKIVMGFTSHTFYTPCSFWHMFCNWLCTFFDAFDRVLFSVVGHIATSHPFLSAAFLIVLSFFPAAPVVAAIVIFNVIVYLFMMGILLCLGLLGFAARGVTRGSFAAFYQSVFYGAFTPRGGLFAASQSYASSARANIGLGIKVVSPFHPFWWVVAWIYRGIAVMILCSHFVKMCCTP